MDAERAKEIISKFKHKHILVIGDVMLDRYVFGNVERLNPEAPVPVLHAKEEKLATGGAGNVAKNLAALGAKVQLVGVVGQDEIARNLKAAAEKEQYTPTLIVDGKRPTTQKIRYMVRSQQMLRVDYEEKTRVSGEIERQVVEAIRATAEVDAIFVSDYAKGLVTEAVAQTVKGHGVPVMADVKPSRASWFAGVTWLSPNRKEAYEFLGLDQFDNGAMSDEDLAKKLKAKFGSTVFLTLSAGGVYVAGEEEGLVPQEHTIEVADTSGAGDAAAAVIVLGKLAGGSDLEAAELANAAGAVVVSKVGAVAPTPKEILNMIVHTHA